ncbi:hypothetical protein [Okeania sp. KiyG1]|uniref:hypothetical protein n=1 Tax=Okeania sp. KiyG1 TaxID=2720165 RepID=UPI0019238D15|nr:hypothetical protein [Okeania sp. KiyG1]
MVNLAGWVKFWKLLRQVVQDCKAVSDRLVLDKGDRSSNYLRLRFFDNRCYWKIVITRRSLSIGL